MNYIFSALIIFIVIFLILNYYNKRRLLKLKNELKENWGTPKKSSEYFNFDLINKYFITRIKYGDDFHQIINDKTADDLDLNEVFKFMDRTSSKIGQQYLYFKIRTPTAKIDELKKFDSLVELFEKDEALRTFCQLELLKINSTNSYYIEELLRKEQIQTPKWFKFVYLLSLAVIVCISLAYFYPVTLLILIPLFITNTFIHYINKKYTNHYLVAISEFLRSITISKNILKNESVKSYFGDLSFLNSILKLRSKSRFISFEKQMEGDFSALSWLFFELIKIMFNVEVLVFFRFIGSIEREQKHIYQLFQYLGEIDSAISVASVRQDEPVHCKPNFLGSKKIQIENCSHPLISKCITNNLDMTSQSMLLTGSNMSGKTTFIRAIGINAILAQTVYTCFAKTYNAPVFRIYTSIGISDSLLEGRSYYLQEVLSIKELIIESEKQGNCLFILDEIFKGTNTLERISSGKAILEYLNKNTHFVFAATHDIELTGLLSKYNYLLYHFSEHVENNELKFDYKLKPGILKTRNAIKILELYNYPAEIIENATNTLEASKAIEFRSEN